MRPLQALWMGEQVEMTHTLSWRKSGERLKLAREILDTPEMREMLAVLELDHPSKNIPTVSDGFGATEQLGIIKGYERCLILLRSLGESLPAPPEPIVATWGPEQQNK